MTGRAHPLTTDASPGGTGAVGGRAAADAEVQPPAAAGQPSPIPRETIAAVILLLGGVGGAFVLAQPAHVAGLAALETLNRWVLYAGTLLACGGLLFLRFVHESSGSARERDALRSTVQVAAVVGSYTTLLALFLHGAAVVGLAPGELLDLRGIARGAAGALQAEPPVRVSSFLRLVGLGLVVLSVRRGSSRAVWVPAAAGGLLAIGSFVLVGHSATAEPRALVIGSSLVHTATASGWFAGLPLLAVALRHRRACDDALGGATMVTRFSVLAAASVGLLTLTGFSLALVHLPSMAALWTHDYGRTLLAKLAFVAFVLAVATYNRRRLVPRIRSGQGAPWGTLHRTVVVEAGGLVLALLATATLVGLVPPPP